MSEYTFTENELNDLREIFFSEASEILQAIDQDVLDVEAGRDRTTALRNIQRHLHTLKGNSRALGFAGLNTLAHKSEDLLKAFVDSSTEPDQDFIDLLLEMKDQLQALVDGHRLQEEVSLDQALLAQIDRRLQSLEYDGAAELSPTCPSSSSTTMTLYDVTIVFEAPIPMKRTGADMILQRLGAMGDVVSVEPAVDSGMIEATGKVAIRLGTREPADVIREAITIPGLVSTVTIEVHGNGSGPRRGDKQTAGVCTGMGSQTFRVDAGRVDKILNLVGELVIGRSMVGQVLSEIGERYKKDDLLKKLGDANAFMEKTLSQLQKNVMKIRMHPIHQIFRKFPRVVRDLSIAQHKEVELVMEGEKTELDKSILDVIGEPLIHLVRNAVDHGIEPPEDRERAGKPRTGTVTLRANHVSNQIVIEVRDDGRGLDPAMLRTKAVEKRVKTQEETLRMSDPEALDLIFLPGFSTAPEVTDISGRGFGMDIIRTTVESLKGRTEVTSKPGEGTTITLRLPLTLAIIRAMLFWVDDRLLAVPMSSIERIVRVRDSDIQSVAGKEVLRYSEKVISLISLTDTLLKRGDRTAEQKKYVIIIGFGEKLYGFAVDRLVGQQELVIKVLENHWGTMHCTSGASILGNGQVVLILDAPAIIMKEVGREYFQAGIGDGL